MEVELYKIGNIVCVYTDSIGGYSSKNLYGTIVDIMDWPENKNHLEEFGLITGRGDKNNCCKFTIEIFAESVSHSSCFRISNRVRIIDKYRIFITDKMPKIILFDRENLIKEYKNAKNTFDIFERYSKTRDEKIQLILNHE